MQWCGLKSEYNRLFHTCVEVTTDAVVWIEIGLNTFSNGRKSVTTDAVVWIENVKVKTTDQMPRGHHWCSGVDWNRRWSRTEIRAISHHWCSGVDWNRNTVTGLVRQPVTTDAVVWIEISGSTGNINMHGVTTDAVVWIEIEYWVLWSFPMYGHHWASGVDWNVLQSIWQRAVYVTTDAVVWIEIL